ncbi:hypothetical protein PSACC_00854 [Paramicrosporidium saccamoebae]|uniref:TLC domain-containing protein n=1 Tax=Paramicrosporidium saccamoebae TaxID=1246581 RepID=A0A2H9TNM3_9FUNG|nr:hypothetical protein PSACC_00854 [Paramicrosporidium saccamoebae]
MTSITTEPIRFWDDDVNIWEDGKLVALWVLGFAIAPLARRLIGEPIAMKKGVSLEAEEEHTVRNRFKRNPNEIKSSHESDSSSQQSLALHKYPSPPIHNLRIEMKRWKFVVSATRMISYAFFIGFTAWAVQGQSSWFWDSNAWHYPFDHVPWRMRTLYFMETAFYLYTLVSMFFEPKMKDRGQMVTHHIFTITLLTKYGTLIMLLHDLSDPWMEAAKLFNYLDIQLGANICFSVFALSFVYLRDYVFPRHIIKATL